MDDILENKSDCEEETQKSKFLIFQLGNDHYGIEIKYVTEIIGIQPITAIPDLPVYVKGVINLRGKIIPVMDVRLRFGMEMQAYDDRTCIIVIDMQDMAIGLVVDRVAEVIFIPDGNIADPPQMNKDFHKYIKGIGKVGNKVKLLLDCSRLLDEEASEAL